MKTKRKALALALCAVLLVVTSVLGTMAYLTDTDNAINTFTVGQVHIKLDEADVDDSTENEDRDKGNAYHLIPGHEYVKDPTVTVEEESENCYVRMLATISYKNEADAVFAKYGVENWLNINDNAWKVNGNPTTTKDQTTTTRTYEFRYVGEKSTNGVVPQNKTAETELEPLFTKVTVPDLVTNDEIATIQGMTINIVAHAIQADGFDTADLAWAQWK